MNDAWALGVPDGAVPAQPLVLAGVDASVAGDEPRLPADHPVWQRDVLSLSSRARAIIATVVPTVVRALAYWDHRVREIALGPRTLGLDAAGCYRLR